MPSPVGFPGVQLYVYGPTPPVAVFTDAAPLAPPLQEILVCDSAVKDGFDMVKVALFEFVKQVGLPFETTHL